MSDFPVIPYGRQNKDEADVAAVAEVLRSDWWTQGPAITSFEQSVAEFCGVSNAVAISNGTAALHIAYLALGLGSGDVLWTVPNTFVATANAAILCGADVDFVDIDPQTYNMDPAALAEKLLLAEQSGKLPSIVVPVHFSGQPCDMAAIKALADRYSFKIVEDACHALGAEYKGGKIGNCQYSDAAVFSFHPVKIVATGEGGMITTKDADIAARMRLLLTHGVTRDPDLLSPGEHGGWYYEQVALGLNYRMPDILAVLGNSQMKRVGKFLERRRELANRYNDLLAGLPIQQPHQAPDSLSSWHLYVVRTPNHDRKVVFDHMRAAGILVNVHYIPVHTQPWYRKRGFSDGDFPISESYYDKVISLPMFYDLTEADQDRVVATLTEVLK